MNRAETMRQSVEEKQQNQVEKLDRFSRLSLQWERDLGEVLLTMREFREAVTKSDTENKQLQREWSESQKKSLSEAVKKQEDTAFRLEQKFGAIEATTRRGVLGWKVALIAVFLLGLGLGWKLATHNPHDDVKLANYFRQLAPEMVQDVLNDGPSSQNLLEEQRRKR